MVAYKDLLGFYRTAIARCIDIMAMGEFDESAAIKRGYHEDVQMIVNVADGPILIVDGNIPIFDDCLGLFDDEEKEVLENLYHILCSLRCIDEEIIQRKQDKLQEVEN